MKMLHHTFKIMPSNDTKLLNICEIVEANRGKKMVPTRGSITVLTRDEANASVRTSNNTTDSHS